MRSFLTRCPGGRQFLSTTESVLSTNGFAYTFLGLYVACNVLLFLDAAVMEAKLHTDFQKYVTAVARGCGATINFNMGVVILLASRSALGFLRETPLNMVLPLDKAMPELHKVVGILIVNAGILHSATHWATYIAKKPWLGGFQGSTSLFISGTILLILAVAIRVVARTVVYQSNYEAFYRIHVGGAIAMFITIVIHGLHYGVPNTWKWIIGPAIIYVIDVSARTFREKRSYLLVSKHSAVFQGPDILKIRLPRVFHFVAGQYAELKVPAISHFQWHPFTIASAPHEAEMTFYIKAVGDWTISLYQLFGERIRSNGADIEVHIRGPFGAATQHVGQFDRVILIGGGVGATPFCSVTKDSYNWISNWTPSKRKQIKSPLVRNFIENRPRGRRPFNIAEDSARNSRNEEQRSNPRDGSRFARTADSETSDSHIFTTNVFSETLALSDLARMSDAGESVEELISWRGTQMGHAMLESFRNSPEQSNYRDSDDQDGQGETSNSGREYVSAEGSSSNSAEAEPNFKDNMGKAHETLQASQFDVRASSKSLSTHATASKASTTRKFAQPFSRSLQAYGDEDGMGSYRENSSGHQRQSVDYYSALYSAYSDQENNEIYQKSLHMIVGMSFGSVSLVKNMQRRRARKNITQAGAEQLPVVTESEDLRIFDNPRVLFLLFLRSVTINMVLLWLLIIRFILAGTAYVFDGLRVFDNSIAIYKSSTLTKVDLVLVCLVVLLVGIPSVLEIVELGAAPVHGIDLFVLTPLALFGLVTDSAVLLGVGNDVQLFAVIHLFVIWPILAVLLLMRLLRVIGERIAQAESLLQTHSSTKAVDFYWTAPTPNDDKWLVDELAPYSNNEKVQMHRYLTRITEAPTNTVIQPPNKQYLHTNYGRPKWSEILNETAENCKNNTTIGVFFCGPHSMGQAVQDACMDAMRNSIIRGLHSGAHAMRRLEEVFGDAVSANLYTGERADSKRAGANGCNVKFVFKRESFA